MRVRAFFVLAVLLVVWAAASSVPSSADTWTWVSGDSALNRTGVYGTKGVAAPTNRPGGRWAGASFCGAASDLWLFGGYGYPASGLEGHLNDLWRYDGTNWTWISGGSVTNQLGNYGTKGVAAPTNVPGARRSPAAWSNDAGALWMLGGLGYAASGSMDYLNDLWKFDGTNWTWLSGSSAANPYGNYGAKGVASPTNVPGGRQGALAWRDASGNLWLFGGYGNSTAGTGRLNDLWKFDGMNWTWVAGSNLTDPPGSYGTKGVAGAGNAPGGRSHAHSWMDESGNLWLFGGYGVDAASATGYLNDLWRFDGANWTWIGGSNTGNQYGVYGTPGVPSPTNQPGGRHAGVAWRATDGSVWIYGGLGYDSAYTNISLSDLWKWDGANWTFVAGGTAGLAGSYHYALGVSSPITQPGSRQVSMGWFTPEDGKLWLFGGQGYDYNMNLGSFGELWARQLSELQEPDLTVSAMSAPATVSHGCAPILVSFTVDNLGGAAGASSVGVYLSDDTTITTADQLLGSTAVPALGPSGTHSGFLDATLPESVDGRFFVGVLADRTEAVTESDETNNTRFTIVYDLSPRLLSIADVLNDQGRSVRITFVRAARDEAESPTPILQYEAFRRIDADASPGGLRAARAPLAPDGTAIAGWEFAGAVPAHGEDEYSMVVPTLRDSSGGGLGCSAFFVRAATATPTTFFDSCRDSGCSVDNLPPAVPAPFAGVPTAGGNALHWGASLETDLAHYRLYRGAEPGFVPGPGNLIAQPADTGYVDAAGAYFYKLSAVDVNGNESGFAVVQITGVIGVPPPQFPCELALGPATPNPVRESALWQLALPRPARVRADVHDAAGRRVCRLADATLDAGYRPLRWDLRDAAGRRVESGNYFLRVRVGERTLGSALTVVR
jgi:N-acetylneuraminic acid mutarotase